MPRFRCRRRHDRDNAARTPACDRTSTGHVWITIWRRYGRDPLPDLLATQPANGICPGNLGWRRPSLRARPMAPHRHPAYSHSSATSLVHSLLAATKIRVCGQLAPGSRSLFLQPCGHLRSGRVACSLLASGLRDAGGPSGVDGFEVIRLTHRCPEGPVTKPAGGLRQLRLAAEREIRSGSGRCATPPRPAMPGPGCVPGRRGGAGDHRPGRPDRDRADQLLGRAKAVTDQGPGQGGSQARSHGLGGDRGRELNMSPRS